MRFRVARRAGGRRDPHAETPEPAATAKQGIEATERTIERAEHTIEAPQRPPETVKHAVEATERPIETAKHGV